MPKRVELFRCTICCATFYTHEEALACEERAMPRHYLAGDEVLVYTLPGQRAQRARILGIHFEEKTHKPLYDLSYVSLEGAMVENVEEHCLRPVTS